MDVKRVKSALIKANWRMFCPSRLFLSLLLEKPSSESFGLDLLGHKIRVK